MEDSRASDSESGETDSRSGAPTGQDAEGGASGASDRRDAGGGSTDASPSRPTEATTGYGITLTLVGAVLLALGYYGVEVISSADELGEAVPAPFYVLAFALLFVTDLLKSRRLGVLALARAIALAVVYGALFVLAVEGGAYLWENPDAALEGFVGVTVFAAALVVAAVVYVGYLTVVDRTF